MGKLPRLEPAPKKEKTLMPSFRFESEGHRYFIDERRVPSVTEVLEPLQIWDGVPLDVLEAARIFGQRVHEACHLMLHDILVWNTLAPELVPYVMAARKAIADLGIKVLASEHRMCDPALAFAGTLDILGVMKRFTCVFDWKSSVTMPRTAGPQTAAYNHLYQRNMGQVRGMKRFGILLRPDGDYRLSAFDDERDWTMFVSALNLWHWRNPQKRGMAA